MSTTTLITGNTYPVKDQIKALGGKWDAAAQGWRVPAAKADEARALVAAAPVEPKTKRESANASGGRRRYSRCASCGSSNNRGFYLCWDCKCLEDEDYR